MQYFLRLPKRLWFSLQQGDFYRNWLRVLWLFFPSFLFVFLTANAFWNIDQGKDLMVYTLENTKVYIFFIIALIFWAYVVWYSSRLVSKAKYWEVPGHLWLSFRVHLPRLLGFTCFTIIILAFLQLQIPESPKISSGWALVLLFLSLFYYIVINRAWSYVILIKETSTRKIYVVFALAFLLCFLSLYIFSSFFVLIVLLLLLQLFSVLFFLVRRKNIAARLHEAKETVKSPQPDYGNAKGFKLLGKKISRLLADPEEKKDIYIFNYIAVLAFGIYVAVISSVRISVFIGSFPFALLAFGVLVGFINILCTFSVFTRFNIHLIIWLYAFIIGSRQEPHAVRLIEKQNPEARFDKRQKLKEYFTNWVTFRYPQPDSIQTPQPVYFVLSDGGASRSGYWVASVLSRWQDSTEQKFSKNLFCLSGASGGSLGNAAFYNLLRSKKTTDDTNYLGASKDYLKGDFLTYTLGRMLGPDVFRYVFFFLMPVKDRAFALSKALEQSAGMNNNIGKSMTDGMSAMITQQDKPDSLPILCINTTRMQDGRPGVICTIDISEYYFNGRIDVLDLVSEEKDLKLSSAVVMGASFPYVSPAGRFKYEYKPGKWEDQYFVDGGYFDNSGAGVVNEMIIAMKQLMQQDSFLKKYDNKFEFFVYHITNNPNPEGEPVLKKVNPLVNDLAAPVRTLAGAYGSQTSVNDSRLRNYMNSYFGPDHYTPVNLYKKNDPLRFSMSWVISRRLLDSMNARLESSAVVKATWQKIKK